jgi:hypothetical protein
MTRASFRALHRDHPGVHETVAKAIAERHAPA